jgi:hypothetical protein
MKRLAFLAAALLTTATARAQDDAPARPERVESAEKPPGRIRTSLLLGGLGLTTGVWAATAGSSYLIEEPGFDRLRYPVVGPWMALANNKCSGGCEFINYFGYIYFTLSGLAQAGGLGLVLESLITPTADPNAPRRPRPVLPAPRGPEAAPPSPGPDAPPPPPSSPSKPLFFLPMPSPVGQSGLGVSFGGLF